MKRNNKGFTLAELLIVVAIVAVLVSISIPLFNGKLKKTKLATNQANIRAAKAAAYAEYLTNPACKGVGNQNFLYDVKQGTISLDDENLTKSQGLSFTENDVYTYILVQLMDNNGDIVMHVYGEDPNAHFNDEDKDDSEAIEDAWKEFQ